MAFLFSNNIAHRDLKPENILIAIPDGKREIQVKICDFEMSAIVRAPPSNSKLSDFCGSPGFFAPEVFILDSYCGFKALR